MQTAVTSLSRQLRSGLSEMEAQKSEAADAAEAAQLAGDSTGTSVGHLPGTTETTMNCNMYYERAAPFFEPKQEPMQHAER